MQKRLSCKNDFESVYLKHNMLKRLNTPTTAKELKKYENIINRTSFIFFNKNNSTFSKISMTIEDVQSITSFYAYIFLSTYNTPEYFDKYKEFEEKEVERKHRNNLIKFLKQKLIYLSLVVTTKSNNILGEKNTTIYLEIPSDKHISLPNHTLIKEYKSLGLKRITRQQFKNRKNTDRFIEISYSNNALLSIEDATGEDFVSKKGDNYVGMLDLLPSNKSMYHNINPYTVSAEDMSIAQEIEVEQEQKMQDPEFIKKMMKTHLRHNKKIMKMLKEKLAELESLG